MMKRILLFTTIILLVVTVFWMIAFYEHIQAYDRMVQEAQEGPLGRAFITWEPFFLWGNFPIFIVSGFILAFAWPILVYGGWKALKQKHAD